MAAWKDGITIASCIIALLVLVGMAIYTWVTWRRRKITERGETQQQVRVRKITLPGEEAHETELPSYSSVVQSAAEPTIVVENKATPKVRKSYQNQALEVKSFGDLSARAPNEQLASQTHAATEPVGKMNGKMENTSEKTWL